MEIQLSTLALFLIILTSVSPAIAQTYVKDNGDQTGKNIILDTPSNITQSNYTLDPQKEKLASEKHKILVDALMAEEAQYGGFKNRAQHLPWSTIGYDYVHNSLEVTILPEYFTADAIPKYFEKIRSIVGNDIDITLSPLPYPTPVEYDMMPVIETGVSVAIAASVIVFLFVRKKNKISRNNV